VLGREPGGPHGQHRIPDRVEDESQIPLDLRGHPALEALEKMRVRPEVTDLSADRPRTLDVHHQNRQQQGGFPGADPNEEITLVAIQSVAGIPPDLDRPEKGVVILRPELKPAEDALIR
jgi:hypothetical protein